MANHDRASLVRYLSGELPSSEKAGVESHLRSCGECSDFVSFTREFRAALKQAAPELLQADTPCPDADTLVAFEAGELDGKTAQLVRQHTIFCKDCLEELHMLRQVREAAGIQEEGQSLFQKLKNKLIKIDEIYGIGAMLGAIRIVAEQPAFVVRGEPFKTFSKLLEMPVGENAYKIELTLTGNGLLRCDIAGFNTPVKGSLSISVLGERGEEIISIKSDDSGRCHFTVPPTLQAGDLCAFSFNLEGTEEGFLFQFPERQK